MQKSRRNEPGLFPALYCGLCFTIPQLGSQFTIHNFTMYNKNMGEAFQKTAAVYVSIPATSFACVLFTYRTTEPRQTSNRPLAASPKQLLPTARPYGLHRHTSTRLLTSCPVAACASCQTKAGMCGSNTVSDGCAQFPQRTKASNRHKNLLFSQLARSLCTAGET